MQLGIWDILGWIVAGLIVGWVARLLVPGRQSMSMIMTIVLGIVGALVGGFLASLIFGPRQGAEPGVATAWPGWIMAIIGGVLVLGIYLALTRNRRAGPFP